jgi:hypothetical protein
LHSTTLVVVFVSFVVIVYLAVAIFAFRLAGKWFPLGPWRPIVRASVIAFFFGILPTGTFAPPVPAWIVVVPTVIECYDAMRCNTWILKLAFIEWLLWVALFLVWYAIPKVREMRDKARLGRYGTPVARQMSVMGSRFPSRR